MTCSEESIRRTFTSIRLTQNEERACEVAQSADAAFSLEQAAQQRLSVLESAKLVGNPYKLGTDTYFLTPVGRR